MNNFDKCRRSCFSRILLALAPGEPRIVYLSAINLVVLSPADGRVAVMDAFCRHGSAQLLGSYYPEWRLPPTASASARFDAAYRQFSEIVQEDLREVLLDWSEADLYSLSRALFARVSTVSPPVWAITDVPTFVDSLAASATRGAGTVLQRYAALEAQA